MRTRETQGGCATARVAKPPPGAAARFALFTGRHDLMILYPLSPAEECIIRWTTRSVVLIAAAVITVLLLSCL